MTLCPRCGLNETHATPEACYSAMQTFTQYLREVLPLFTPFCSCWEMEPWRPTDGEEVYKEIATKVRAEREY